MTYVDSIFVTLQALYMHSGLDDKYLTEFIADSYSKPILYALKFRGKFMLDFDFIDEINSCIEKAISNYDALSRVK